MSRFIGSGLIGQDTRRIAVLMPYIQTEENQPIEEINFEKCLVVDLDTLNTDYAAVIEDMSNSDQAKDVKNLMDLLQHKTFRDGKDILQTLHNTKNIVTLPALSVNIFINNSRSCTQAEINRYIKQEMINNRDGEDVDSYRRKEAKEYNRRLQEERDIEQQRQERQRQFEQHYPDFNNPSDKGENVPSDIDEEILSKYNLESKARKEIDEDVLYPKHDTADEPKYDEYLAQPKQEQPMSKEDVMQTHRNLLTSFDEGQNKINDMSKEAFTYIDMLDGVNNTQMMEQLKNYSTSGKEEVHDTLVDLLSEYYPNLDGEYIKKNLKNAEKRKDKK